MNIVHHSNYIRILEETRVDFLEQVGMPFQLIEDMGLMMPVLSVDCTYKFPLRFGDEFEVHSCIEKFNGTVLKISYEIINSATGQLCVEARSSHCFTNNDLKPVRTKNNYPDVYNIFAQYVGYTIK